MSYVNYQAIRPSRLNSIASGQTLSFKTSHHRPQLPLKTLQTQK